MDRLKGSTGMLWVALVLAPELAHPQAMSPDAPVGDALEEVVVTGSRLSRLRAIEAKRESETIIDAVSANDIGNLPDYNTAEAISRLPGISTQLDQGEARYAVIRGVDPNLNHVLFDGNLIGAPEAEGRRVSLDTIPSDLVRTIEVVKAITPDLHGNAIGGQINIVTPTGFDGEINSLNFSARGGYNEKAGQFGAAGSLLYTTRLGADESWGLALGTSYNRRRFQTNLYEPIDWAPQGATGIVGPDSVRYFDYSIMRERIGAIANVDWRANDSLRLTLRSVYNEYTDEEGRQQAEFDHTRGTVTAISPTRLSYSRGEVFREFRQNEQTQKIYNVSLGFESNLEGRTWTGSYTLGRGEEVTPVRNDIEFRAQDVSASVTTPSIIELATPRAEFVSIGPRFFDAASFRPRRFFFRDEEIGEDLGALKTDLRFDNVFGERSGYIKVGLSYIDRDKERDNSRLRFDSTLPSTVTLATIPGAAVTQPEPWFDGRYEFGPYMDYRALQSWFGSNRATGFVNNAEVAVENEFSLDYRIDERISAAYAMASAEFGAVTLLGGVRVEKTKLSTNAFQIRDTDGDGVLETSDITPLAGGTDYTDVLPALHLTWRISDRTQLRTAYTEAIGRPDYDDIVPTFSVDGDEGVAGNPALEPFRAQSLDLSLEHYPDAESIVALGLFYKRIENPVFSRTLLNTTFNGVALDSLTRPENANDGWLLGLEGNVVWRFTQLPGFLGGLGASLNGTWVKSEVQVIGRETEDLPFFRQSEWIANAALFYERGPFEARLAWSYRDDYLEAVGADADGDIYWGDRGQWDLQTSVELREGISVFASISNFSDASRIEYQGRPNRRFAEEIYDYTINFGISGKF